jgi:uncharacterized protein (DUF4415 family)
MQKNENIVRYTAEEVKEMIQRGEDKTNWEKFDAITDEELEDLIASDPDEAGWQWGPPYAVNQSIGVPKKQVTVRLDQDVIDWFKAQGKGYQTRMNAVLRQYMEHHSN